MRLPTVVVREDVLLSWLTLSDCTRAQLAKELGVSSGRVSQLLSAKEAPSAHLMAKMMRRTSLPFRRLFQIIDRQPTAAASPHKKSMKPVRQPTEAKEFLQEVVGR